MIEHVKGIQPFGHKRHKGWYTLRNEFISFRKRCECCDDKRHLEVHHKFPVYKFPILELEWGNLIVLCRRCHFLVGHLKNWKSYNEDVRSDAALLLDRIKNRP